ncbi:MAG: hypothetical protein COS42_02370 [Flavobacteriales bacterium CG03_land_8_20_14_0_80_35_15]|nr:MAG: hypothetical protein COS42_02370 [Flavobacteriales bacterium CG03_land_8_20_14_0_80_35_15]
MKTDENSLVNVFISIYLHEIYLAKNKLALKNIDSYIFDDNLNAIIGTTIVEGCKLKVKVKDFEKARTILNLYLT